MEKKNPYWESWRGGLQQGIENPIIGLGVASYRKHCSNMISSNVEWLPGQNICVNHPHNFYIQLFCRNWDNRPLVRFTNDNFNNQINV